MPRTRIKTTKMPGSSKAEYLRYFRESAEEYHARADRLERRLLGGGTIKGSPDLQFQLPSWEIGDVCCFTDASKVELQAVLPPLFDSLRRVERAHAAAMAAQHVRRQDRLSLAARGVEEMLFGYLKKRPGQDEHTENMIDRWLGQMLGPCRWSERDHFDYVCQKPVPWTKVDMGGGRSKGSSARTLYVVRKATADDHHNR